MKVKDRNFLARTLEASARGCSQDYFNSVGFDAVLC